MSDFAPEFSGRVALVTGGARGIGRACCLRLAAGGAQIALNYTSNHQAAAETKVRTEYSDSGKVRPRSWASSE